MSRIALAAAAGIAALVVLAVTLWFLGDALLLLFQEKGLSPPAAAALTGVIGLVAAAFIAGMAQWLLRAPRRPALPAARGNGIANGIAADLGALAAQQIVNTTRAHPYGTAGAALAAGLAVGAVPELRKSLMGLFKH